MTVTLTWTSNFTATAKSAVISVSALTGVEPFTAQFSLESITGFSEDDPVNANPRWDMGAGHYPSLSALNDTTAVPADVRFPRKTAGVYYGAFCGHVFLASEGSCAPTLSIRDVDGSDFSIPFNQWRNADGDLIGTEIVATSAEDWFRANGSIYVYSIDGDFTGAPAAGATCFHITLDGTHYGGAVEGFPGHWNQRGLNGVTGGVNGNKRNNTMLMFKGGEDYTVFNGAYEPGSNCRITSWGTGRATLDVWSGRSTTTSLVAAITVVNSSQNFALWNVDFFCSPIDVTDPDNPLVVWWNALSYSSASGFFQGNTSSAVGETLIEKIGGVATGVEVELIGDNHPAFGGLSQGKARATSLLNGTRIDSGTRVTGPSGSATMIREINSAGMVILNAIRGTITNGETLSSGGNSFVITDIPGGSASEADNQLYVKVITGGTLTNGSTLEGATSGTTCTYVVAGSRTSRTDYEIKATIPKLITVNGGGYPVTARDVTVTGANEGFATPQRKGNGYQNLFIRKFFNYGFTSFSDTAAQNSFIGVVLANGRDFIGPWETGTGSVANNRSDSFTYFLAQAGSNTNRSYPVVNVLRHTAARIGGHYRTAMHYCYLESFGGHGNSPQPLLRSWTNGQANRDAEGNVERVGHRFIVDGCGFWGILVLLAADEPTFEDVGTIITPDGVQFSRNHFIAAADNFEHYVTCPLTNTYVWNNLFELPVGNYTNIVTAPAKFGNPTPAATEFVRSNAGPSEYIGNTLVWRGTMTGSVQAWETPTFPLQRSFTIVDEDNVFSYPPAAFSTAIAGNTPIADLDATTLAVTSSAPGFEAAVHEGFAMVRDWTGEPRVAPKSKGYREPA